MEMPEPMQMVHADQQRIVNSGGLCRDVVRPLMAAQILIRTGLEALPHPTRMWSCWQPLECFWHCG